MTLVVVHLARWQNGLQPLDDFLSSYVRRPAGVSHQLLFALKGFPSEQDATPWLETSRARGVRADHAFVPDDGFDLTAYVRVAKQVPADRYCFLNSFSRVFADDWLAPLAGALDRPGVGLAGATGSWASQHDYRRYQLGLASGYDAVFDGRERTRLAFLELVRASRPEKRNNGRLPFKAMAAFALLRERGGFEPFPTPHIRTNAFAISRDTLMRLRLSRIRSKWDAYRLESGRASITRQIEGMGLRTVVVGREGSPYDADHWHESLTLWQSDQQNLLVADNQTELYAHCDRAQRDLLSRFAWGREARPG